MTHSTFGIAGNPSRQRTHDEPPFRAGELVVARFPSGSLVIDKVVDCRRVYRLGWMVRLDFMRREVRARSCSRQPELPLPPPPAS